MAAFTPHRQPVLYGDVELLTITYLTDVLGDYPLADGVTFASQVPKLLVPPFVLVRQVGGSKPRYALKSPTLDVQVWHRTENEACDLADLVSGLLEVMPGYGNVRDVRETASPVFVPDTESGAARYLMTHQLTLKGAHA